MEATQHPSISHREMRNSSSEVLRAVAAGESYTITNHGVAVARIVPVHSAAPELPLARSATRQGGWALLSRRRIDEAVDQALADLRGER